MSRGGGGVPPPLLLRCTAVLIHHCPPPPQVVSRSNASSTSTSPLRGAEDITLRQKRLQHLQIRAPRRAQGGRPG